MQTFPPIVRSLHSFIVLPNIPGNFAQLKKPPDIYKITETTSKNQLNRYTAESSAVFCLYTESQYETVKTQTSQYETPL